MLSIFPGFPSSRLLGIFALLLILRPYQSLAFRSASMTMLSSRGRFRVTNPQRSFPLLVTRRITLLEKEREVSKPYSYDPLNLSSESEAAPRRQPRASDVIAPVASLSALLAGIEQASAEASASVISRGDLNPSTFQPVCPASDGFYRFLQESIKAIVGSDKFIEYGPLIAGGLLRVRLELCVVESFFNEAVGPFIAENGLSWVLPLHETVETFLAGSIFALATTFILVGSTKLLTVVFTYFDLIVGLPSRTFGGFFYDRALGRPLTLDIGFGPLKTRILGPTDEIIEKKRGEELVDMSSPLTLLIVTVSGTIRIIGTFAGFAREFLEAIDLFVGRYLVLLASGYILIKFLHYKVFPEFP